MASKCAGPRHRHDPTAGGRSWASKIDEAANLGLPEGHCRLPPAGERHFGARAGEDAYGPSGRPPDEGSLGDDWKGWCPDDDGGDDDGGSPAPQDREMA